jgi:hypothetical protein
MRSGTVIDVTFAGDISETINFWRTKSRLAANWKAGEQLIRESESSAEGIDSDPDDAVVRKNWTWHRVPGAAIVDFLTDYQEHEASRKVKTKLLADYIRMELDQDRLTHWTVLIAPGGSKNTGTLGTATFRLVERSWFLTDGGDEHDRFQEREALQKQNHYRIRRLVSPKDEERDLDEGQIATALAETIAEWAKDPGTRAQPERPSGAQLRRVRPATQGLLILYPLDPADAGEKVHETGKVEADAVHIPVLGFAISFPAVADEKASKVRYVVNNVYYRQEFGMPAAEPEELI